MTPLLSESVHRLWMVPYGGSTRMKNDMRITTSSAVEPPTLT